MPVTQKKPEALPMFLTIGTTKVEGNNPNMRQVGRAHIFTFYFITFLASLPMEGAQQEYPDNQAAQCAKGTPHIALSQVVS